MKRTTRITTLVLLVFLVLAGLSVILSAGAAAFSSGPRGFARHATLAARGGAWSVRVIRPAPPKLGPVPKVVKSTTSKKPPKNVKFDGQPVPGGITTGTGTATGGPGEVIIPGVPGYVWRDGCGPTAVGMVIGYYDGNGWDNLIPGDATSDTTDVDQAISSHGSASQPQSYEDYAEPLDYSGTVLPDESSLDPAHAHASDSVADFMQTSWSADRLVYGWSYSNMVGPAFTGYVQLKYAGNSPTVTTYSGTNLTWALVKQEVDNDRPMIFMVDSDGDGIPDHFVTVVGYRETDGYPEYACWDTWSMTLLRWQQFRAVSSAYAWGVFNAYAFSISGPSPSPSPSPTASATPTPSPSPTADVTAPVTTQTGADAAWHNSSVTVTFSATDAQSGVATTEYAVDDGAWQTGTTVTLPIWKRGGGSGIHTVDYRSTDRAGNIEPTESCTVKIDSMKPATSAKVAQKQPKSATVQLTPTDNLSGVAATYSSLDGQAWTAGTVVTVKGSGHHWVDYYSMDVAGNVESVKELSVTL